MKFDDVKKDYLKIIEKYGFPDDMSGGFVDSDHIEKVILNPTKKNAMNYMIRVIQYGFQNRNDWSTESGYIAIYSDEFLKEMYEKYC